VKGTSCVRIVRDGWPTRKEYRNISYRVRNKTDPRGWYNVDEETQRGTGIIRNVNLVDNCRVGDVCGLKKAIADR
jgi:hypothetical protein